jgi:NAD(P)-binding Rossmann-like domain
MGTQITFPFGMGINKTVLAILIVDIICLDLLKRATKATIFGGHEAGSKNQVIELADSEVLIYGAGMSGLVAAYNLAKEGYAVLVRDREANWGGSDAFNPSIHTTPLDLNATSEYIGIDIAPAFHEITSLSLYLHDLMIPAPIAMSYHVERSSRPQSLDALLYGECVEVGVKFEFNTALRKEDLSSLPPGTIIACGLNQAAYDFLQIPHKPWFAWMARGEIEHENSAWIWLDECITEYGYISYCNDIYYNLLFSFGREVTREGLERYCSFMSRMEGVEEDQWGYISGAAPIMTSDNPGLFRDGFIMCGTMSGMIDPFMGFGISGGLISGKVAAIAVSDPQKAEQEFARFTRNFDQVYRFKQEVWGPLRTRVDIMEDIARILGTERTVKLIIEGLRKGRKNSAIPGFSPVSCS